MAKRDGQIKGKENNAVNVSQPELDSSWELNKQYIEDRTNHSQRRRWKGDSKLTCGVGQTEKRTALLSFPSSRSVLVRLSMYVPRIGHRSVCRVHANLFGSCYSTIAICHEDREREWLMIDEI